jgi:hypothetical protein
MIKSISRMFGFGEEKDNLIEEVVRDEGIEKKVIDLTLITQVGGKDTLSAGRMVMEMSEAEKLNQEFLCNIIKDGDIVVKIIENVSQIVRMDQVLIIKTFQPRILIEKAQELRIKMGDLVLTTAKQKEKICLRKRIKSTNKCNLIWSDIYLLLVLHVEEITDYASIDERIKEQLFTIKKSTVNNSIKNNLTNGNNNDKRINKRSLSPNTDNAKRLNTDDDKRLNSDDAKRLGDGENDDEEEYDEDFDDTDIIHESILSHDEVDLNIQEKSIELGLISSNENSQQIIGNKSIINQSNLSGRESIEVSNDEVLNILLEFDKFKIEYNMNMNLLVLLRNEMDVLKSSNEALSTCYIALSRSNENFIKRNNELDEVIKLYDNKFENQDKKLTFLYNLMNKSGNTQQLINSTDIQNQVVENIDDMNEDWGDSAIIIPLSQELAQNTVNTISQEAIQNNAQNSWHTVSNNKSTTHVERIKNNNMNDRDKFNPGKDRTKKMSNSSQYNARKNFRHNNFYIENRISSDKNCNNEQKCYNKYQNNNNNNRNSDMNRNNNCNNSNFNNNMNKHNMNRNNNSQINRNNDIIKIYIGNIRNGTKIEKIEKIIKKLNVEMKDVFRLKNNHSYYQSYVFTGKRQDKNLILTPEQWPKGIKVREFIEI